jgi:hypothetical protein
MQWSKLKARVESFFAPAVAGRVELRTTNYRHVHDGAGRGWITIDGREVYNFCTQKYWVEGNALSEGIRTANRATDWRDPAQEGARGGGGAGSNRLPNCGKARLTRVESTAEASRATTIPSSARRTYP